MKCSLSLPFSTLKMQCIVLVLWKGHSFAQLVPWALPEPSPFACQDVPWDAALHPIHHPSLKSPMDEPRGGMGEQRYDCGTRVFP